MFDLSLQGLKGDICHSHSLTLAEYSHATYHYLSILGDKQYLGTNCTDTHDTDTALSSIYSLCFMSFADNKVKFFKEGIDGFKSPFLYSCFVPALFIWG